MSVIDNIYDIKHHSPSTCNSFIEYRHQWFLQKIRGLRLPGSHPMARGKAVEEGINFYLKNEGAEFVDCIKAGIELWDKEIIALGDNLEFRQSLGPCIKEGIKFFQSKGYDDGMTVTQAEIKVTLGKCKLPFKGFLDFLRPEILLDTKCVGKTPSMDKATGLYKQKQGYCLQAAVYQAATGLDPCFIYIIPLAKEIKVIEAPFSQSDLDWGLNLATRAAEAIETIISTPIEGSLFQALMFPNPDAIYGQDNLNIVLGEFGL